MGGSGSAGSPSSSDAEAAFTRLDANRDGMIDRQEASRMRGLGGAFERADSNQDRMLDKTEFSAASAMLK
jgi:EF hand